MKCVYVHIVWYVSKRDKLSSIFTSGVMHRDAKSVDYNLGAGLQKKNIFKFTLAQNILQQVNKVERVIKTPRLILSVSVLNAKGGKS